MMHLIHLDYYLGRVCEFLYEDEINFNTAIKLLEDRINSKERYSARCKPITIADSDEIIKNYSFNIGSTLKHIFAYTRTCRKGSVPNKLELRVALRYLRKEKERLESEQRLEKENES